MTLNRNAEGFLSSKIEIVKKKEEKKRNIVICLY